MKKYYLISLFLILLFTSVNFSFPRVDAAEIVYTKGKVQVQFGKDKIWRGAKTGMRMDSGDSLKTARRSHADIALDKDNFIRVQEQTLVVFDSTTPGLINKFDLSQGELYANVESIREGLSFEVSTPSSVVGVRGTGWYVKSDFKKDEILVHEGTVFVRTFDKRKQALKEMIRVVKSEGVVYVESFNKYYLGKGLFFLLRNIVRDIYRHKKIALFWLIRKKYDGLLPGDIVYDANKVEGAAKGYAHLPSILELLRLKPTHTKLTFNSIPQITNRKKIDVFKYFRYSIWMKDKLD